MDWTAAFTLLLAISTLVLAGVTGWLVFEARKSREEEEIYRREGDDKRKEVVFRAAILELSNHIIDLTTWHPGMNSQSDIWWDYPLKFPRLQELMDSVWIESKLWERITRGSLILVKRNETELRNLIKSQHTDQNQNDVRNIYFFLDLYLKQLIRYIFCEMQRQKLTTPAGIWNSKVFQPSAYIYGDLKYSPRDTVRLIEIGNSLPAEPEDRAFNDCRLEILITQARQAVDAESQSFH